MLCAYGIRQSACPLLCYPPIFHFVKPLDKPHSRANRRRFSPTMPPAHLDPYCCSDYDQDQDASLDPCYSELQSYDMGLGDA